MKAREDSFRRLLKWYPKLWREHNGAVLVSTMLEQAERDGRTAPSASERRSVVVHGLGARMNSRLALWCALSGLAVAALAGALSVWASVELATSGARWLLPVLSVAVGPLLIAIGGVALARERSLLSDPRSLVVIGLLSLALPAAALAGIGWGLAFNAADEGATPTGLGAWWDPLFLGAWAFGAAGITTFIESVLSRTRLRRAGRIVLSTAVGVIVAPLIGFWLISPYAALIGAAALALVALAVTARPGPETAPVTHVEQPAKASRTDASARALRLARVLAWLSVVASAVGIVYGLTGSVWSPGAADGTVAMGQGITIAFASAVPLLAAIGLAVATRARTSATHVWGPLALVALSFTAAAIAYIGAPNWDRMAPGFAAASILCGSALAWWLIPRLRGPRNPRIAIGVLIGAGYAAILGILVTPMLAFVLPVLAVVFAIAGTRLPRAAPGVYP